MRLSRLLRYTTVGVFVLAIASVGYFGDSPKFLTEVEAAEFSGADECECYALITCKASYSACPPTPVVPCLGDPLGGHCTDQSGTQPCGPDPVCRTIRTALFAISTPC